MSTGRMDALLVLPTNIITLRNGCRHPFFNDFIDLKEEIISIIPVRRTWYDSLLFDLLIQKNYTGFNPLT